MANATSPSNSEPQLTAARFEKNLPTASKKLPMSARTTRQPYGYAARVPLDALALALGAAVVHAAWNVGLAGAADTRAAMAVALLAGTLLWAPIAVATWDVSAAAWPYVIASA